MPAMDDVSGRFLGGPPAAAAPRPRSGLTLHLGVLVQPYRALNWDAKKKRRMAGAALPMSTGDVAAILEARYGIMDAFSRMRGRDISKAIEGSLEGALEALVMGQTIDPWGRGMQAIQQSFRQFIASREAERAGIPGTPTKAALRGVNHRLKHPYSSRNPRRPSFRDTGLYMTSMRAWID